MGCEHIASLCLLSLTACAQRAELMHTDVGPALHKSIATVHIVLVQILFHYVHEILHYY